MRLFLKIISYLFAFGVTMAIVVGIGVVAMFDHYAQDLPDITQLETYNPPVTTRLYAGDGRLLEEYATEKRIYVPLSVIPKRVSNAFIAAEDKNFYTHPGIDFYGLARAVLTNARNKLTGAGGLVGGSTITQQVVKNFLLTNERTLERKVKEAILAFRISKAFSKDRILELYLNRIFLGERSYGVAAAALNYFNKSLDELKVEEAALLAALPKAPSYYNPVRNPARAKERRDSIIHLMQENGFITAEEAEKALASPVALKQRDNTERVHAEVFAEEVRRALVAAYGEEKVYEGGLFVKTTLDPELQRAAETALQKALVEYDRRHGYRGAVMHLSSTADWQNQLAAIPSGKVPLIDDQQLAIVLALEPDHAQLGLSDGASGKLAMDGMAWAKSGLSSPSELLKVGDVIIAEPLEKQDDAKKKSAARYALAQVPAVNGAIVAIDPHTGRVLAMSGGYAARGDAFNRATQAKRQPGSAFKPFVYLTALENGFTPSTIVVDAPVELSQGTGLPMWKPQNYKGDYLGAVTMRIGIEKSRNAMTVRLAQMTGLTKILEMAERFGIYDKPPANFSIVLGSAETTPLRLTAAYGMLANGGKKIIPSLIERIDDRDGKTIYRRDSRPCAGCVEAEGEQFPDALPPIPPDTRERIVDARIAYQITSMLEGVVQRGTGVRAKEIGKPVAGKTGTTNESRDTWFVGFTPNLAAGVFIGYDTPKPMGSRETGSSVALPGFIDFMKQALKDKPSVPFRTPPDIELVKMDMNTGLPASASPGGKTIYEAFLTGPPIWKPGQEPMAQDAEDAEDVAAVQSEEQPIISIAPEVEGGYVVRQAPEPFAPPSDAPGVYVAPITAVPSSEDAGTLEGTGGLY